MKKTFEKRYVEFNLFREKSGRPTMSRREFMRLVAMTSVGLSIPFVESCKSDSGGLSLVDAQTDAGNSDGAAASCSGCARVAISRDPDVITSVRTAIDLAGGLSEIKGGDKVVIKPNMTGELIGIVTSPDVLRAVVEAIATRTDKKNITLAECCAFGLPTRKIADIVGYTALVDDLGINFLAFDEESYNGFKDPKWEHITDEKSVPVSLYPMTFDHFINVPKLKNHEQRLNSDVEFTCCMKTFVGLLPYSGDGSRISDDIHTADLGEKVAELGCIVPTITMNIVDAIRPGLVNGPAPTRDSEFADAGLILASKDRVACDSLSVAVLKTYAIQNGIDKPYVNKSVWEQAQIKRGGELGLGIVDPKNIEIIDHNVDNIADIKAQWV
jgi:uncharacterized protein (DUF362 family)